MDNMEGKIIFLMERIQEINKASSSSKFENEKKALEIKVNEIENKYFIDYLKKGSLKLKQFCFAILISRETVNLFIIFFKVFSDNSCAFRWLAF